MPTLLARLRQLPGHTIIYYTSLMEDAAGSHFIDATQSVPLVAASEALPDSPRNAKQQLQELINSAGELGADIHTVSHRLHSATLESLGLEPGVSSLCKEFTDRHGIEIDF